MGFKKSVFQKTTLSLGLLIEKNVLLVSQQKATSQNLTWQKVLSRLLQLQGN